ncbi:MAG: class I SAM-dependent methyltransferase, partial [Calditrichota bacterium]
VGPGDYVIDLGSGDGRIVIAAAKHGAEAHGVDLDPQRIKEARDNARRAGVDNQVMFVQGNIFDTDFSQASVVTMYLLSSVNLKLRPRLLQELRPGTRVVSHSFDMGDWEPDSTSHSDAASSSFHYVYFWIITAQVDGTWNWNLDGKQHSLAIQQKYQNIDLDYQTGNSAVDTYDAVLRGDRISFIADNGNQHYVYSGHVDGNRISGIVQIRNGQNQHIATWTASRN